MASLSAGWLDDGGGGRDSWCKKSGLAFSAAFFWRSFLLIACGQCSSIRHTVTFSSHAFAGSVGAAALISENPMLQIGGRAGGRRAGGVEGEGTITDSWGTLDLAILVREQADMTDVRKIWGVSRPPVGAASTDSEARVSPPRSLIRVRWQWVP